MTVLVAVNEKNKIILGADSGAFHGDYHVKDLSKHKGRRKITTINDITFSSTGKVSEVCNFGLFCSTRKPEDATEIAIQRFFVDFGKFIKNMNLGEKVKNNYFIVFKQKLFHYSYGGVEQICEGDFETDGAGFKESYMALHLGKSVKQAIQLTIDMNCWAAGAIQIVEIEKE